MYMTEILVSAKLRSSLQEIKDYSRGLREGYILDSKYVARLKLKSFIKSLPKDYLHISSAMCAINELGNTIGSVYRNH